MEDFPLRGLIWAKPYVPTESILDQVVDEDERTVELPFHGAPGAIRCLWLGTVSGPSGTPLLGAPD